MSKGGKKQALWAIFVFLIVTLAACQGENRNRNTSGTIEVNQKSSQSKPDLEQLRNSDQDGRTFLHQVVIKGDMQSVRWGIEKGVPLEKQDKYGYTPLHYAARHGHKEIAQLLISQGVNLNPRTRLGYTPLHWATRMGYTNLAQLLIANGADTEAKDIDGRTPKDFALKGDSRQVRELFYPLHLAVENGDMETVKAFLEKEPGMINARNTDGRTPLHLAQWYDRADIIELLVRRGVNPKAQDKWGFSPGYYSLKEREKRTGINLLDPYTLKQVDHCVYRILNNYEHINVGLVENGEIILTRSYGNNRLDKDDVYASVSKPVTAMIALQLLEEGKIKNLDDDIRDYSVKYRDCLPEKYENTPITFMHLLTHRSGVSHLSNVWEGKKLNLAFVPGSHFQYATSGYGILGEIMAEITGQSFDTLVKKYIGKPVNAASFWAENMFRAPGARVHSTIGDMALFARGIINAVYVSTDTLENLMYKQYSGVTGLGWSCFYVDTPDLTLFHAGSNGTPRAFLSIKPMKKLAVTLLGINKSRDGDMDFVPLSQQLMSILEYKNDNGNKNP